MTMEPEPQSLRRTLRGESIRSLRGLLRQSLSNSNLAGLPLEEEQRRSSVRVKLLENSEDHPKHDKRHLAEIEETNTKPTATAISLQILTSDEVRLRLLQNLGIQKQQDPTPSNPATNNSNSEPWGPSYTQDLNDADYMLHEKPYARKLQFYPAVQVHPIPSHKVFSNRIKQTIWAGVAELRENVARNSVEFSYEDWDPDQVLDEETGLIYHQGEWIHPVHIELEQERQEDEHFLPLSSDAIWKQTCEQLGIQPAEYYHALPTDSQLPPK